MLTHDEVVDAIRALSWYNSARIRYHFIIDFYVQSLRHASGGIHSRANHTGKKTLKLARELHKLGSAQVSLKTEYGQRIQSTLKKMLFLYSLAYFGLPTVPSRPVLKDDDVFEPIKATFKIGILFNETTTLSDEYLNAVKKLDMDALTDAGKADADLKEMIDRLSNFQLADSELTTLELANAKSWGSGVSVDSQLKALDDALGGLRNMGFANSTLQYKNDRDHDRAVARGEVKKLPTYRNESKVSKYEEVKKSHKENKMAAALLDAQKFWSPLPESIKANEKYNQTLTVMANYFVSTCETIDRACGDSAAITKAWVNAVQTYESQIQNHEPGTLTETVVIWFEYVQAVFNYIQYVPYAESFCGDIKEQLLAMQGCIIASYQTGQFADGVTPTWVYYLVVWLATAAENNKAWQWTLFSLAYFFCGIATSSLWKSGKQYYHRMRGDRAENDTEKGDLLDDLDDNPLSEKIEYGNQEAATVIKIEFMTTSLLKKARESTFIQQLNNGIDDFFFMNTLKTLGNIEATYLVDLRLGSEEYNNKQRGFHAVLNRLSQIYVHQTLGTLLMGETQPTYVELAERFTKNERLGVLYFMWVTFTCFMKEPGNHSSTDALLDKMIRGLETTALKYRDAGIALTDVSEKTIGNTYQSWSYSVSSAIPFREQPNIALLSNNAKNVLVAVFDIFDNRRNSIDYDKIFQKSKYKAKSDMVYSKELQEFEKFLDNMSEIINAFFSEMFDRHMVNYVSEILRGGVQEISKYSQVGVEETRRRIGKVGGRRTPSKHSSAGWGKSGTTYEQTLGQKTSTNEFTYTDFDPMAALMSQRK